MFFHAILFGGTWVWEMGTRSKHSLVLRALPFSSMQVPEVIEDSGDSLNLFWAATQPSTREGVAGLAAPSICRAVVELMHAFLTKGGPSAGQTLVSSGAAAPAVHVSLIHVSESEL